jgi:phosphate transport system protein
MPRETFEQALQRLQDELLVLGSLVENAILDSVESLKKRDMEGSRRIIAQDRRINEKRFEIENEALVLIATQQPMAGDLRTIAAVLEITTELERIGDYAKGIAKINLMIGETPLIKPLIDIPSMAEKMLNMLRRALNAFVARDVELARAISEEDEMIDALYNQVYRELIACIMSNTRNIDQANFLLWVAHNLERAADRVINICERVVFTVTGDMQEMDTQESEDLSVESLH